MNAKDIVVAATTKLFVEQNPAAIDEYFGPVYVQHSALAADGLEGIRALANNFPPGFRYEPVRAIAQGDLVVAHGIFHGFSDVPLIAFDVFRVENDRIVEHWDSLTPLIADTASGRSQTDGPVDPIDLELTGANKALIEEWMEKVLIGADYSVLTNYISTETYLQHNPEAADGLDGFGAAVAAWAEQGKNLVYTKAHQVIAEGNFVFTRAAGEFGVPVVYNDLWRVEDGKIVEHWDIISAIPAELPHQNGVF